MGCLVKRKMPLNVVTRTQSSLEHILRKIIPAVQRALALHCTLPSSSTPVTAGTRQGYGEALASWSPPTPPRAPRRSQAQPPWSWTQPPSSISDASQERQRELSEFIFLLELSLTLWCIPYRCAEVVISTGLPLQIGLFFPKTIFPE